MNKLFYQKQIELKFLIKMLVNRLNLVKLFSSFAKKNGAPKTQNNFQTFASDMKNNKDIYAQYQKQIQKDTILNKFRRDVFKKQEISEQVKAYNEDLEKQSHMMQDLLHRGSKQDVIKYSKKIMEKLMNKKKVFKDQTINTVFSDYGDYSSYRTNFAKIEDRNLGSLQRIDQDSTQQNLYKFLDQLPDEYEEKDQIRQRIKQDFQHTNLNMSIADYGKIIQERVNQQQHITQGKLQHYETYKEGKQRKFRTLGQYYKEKQITIDRSSDIEHGTHFRVARLSPMAMNTIYECYLQGWTVRDISKRFGISPKRTKFCVWARAQLYDELLPKYGWKFYYEGLQKQIAMGEQDGYMDYGIDLDKIQSERMPDQIVEWNPFRVDAQRKQQEYILALHKLETVKKFDRHQKMQVGTHGKQNKMYLLKEWTIFRGKGSDFYHLRNHTFRGLSKNKKNMVKQYY